MSAIAPSARRYDSATIAEARKMAEGGWSAYKIAQILNRKGIPVHEGTVRSWVDDRYAERRQLANRARMRRTKADVKVSTGGPWFRADASPAYKLARLHALDAAGVPASSIAKVIELDFGDRLNDGTIRNALRDGIPPQCWRPEGEKRMPSAGSVS